MTETVINLPFPVSVNAMYRNLTIKGKPRRAKSERYRIWEQAAGWDIAQQKPVPVKGPYQITLILTRPDGRRRDAFNLEKGVSDLLVKHGIIEDDALMEVGTVRWGVGGRGVQVRIRPYGGDDGEEIPGDPGHEESA